MFVVLLLDKLFKFVIVDCVKVVLCLFYVVGDVTKDEYRRICKCVMSEVFVLNVIDDVFIVYIVYCLCKW